MPFMNNIYLLPDLGDGCWVLGIDEVFRGGRMGYYIGLMGLSRKKVGKFS